MKHLFIPYELAVIAKEKGFNEPCLAKHDLKHILLRVEECKSQEQASEFEYILAPLYQQIVDWFREKHNIAIEINFGVMGYMVNVYKIRTTSLIFQSERINLYYEALNKAIEEAFKLI